ncbi:UDP-N-acetylmuramate--L-alanine ligase [Companilactobacillus paralimentarius DSM 13238 = JCM 10415]|jgi:UDP-N-acetylmuramate--alanine ligase|uniref:UDP-N-acetylmuramate--L-alanine ligase n=1 Tax=Companilactobacillus paralimentarius DSM 13238 = JCM 10415 TaxID=1122151 RepID=A0A0R1PDL6_9LACO|nr:UDP-N-acetylmuramate--L-alanine ligase [Companilactobacillus paralimentarius]KAE9561933.1 UDP-N-acetylmuramate--alanine ligase [Companilactobacillus paralimentarius]KRL28226.1 UDP-N-acetylmuramate--L-alanine ligase [Companilactobacillus paralimentarius DSM 13238 = JCM 10415]MDR4934384.1 UDP-N-acetylmuramate--L-alanine ligase [Companilactobacillus paralimentarius]QFR68619.1 UDP-N-acetylmuramate--L-alanine ligase [Companilactobacillus paralimentarius]
MEKTVYHFVGIKGTGMSALALILKDLGYEVQGSDIDKYTFTQRGLEQAGIKILPFDEKNIHEGLTIVKGNAFSNDQVEIKKANDMHLKVITYPELVGTLVSDYTSIGIAGSHGKTSTTGLLAHTLSGIAKTSYLIGDGTGKGIKDAKFFVFEADEYRRHFLAYSPDYLIITNIDFDHPDYFFGGINDVVDAFESEARKTKKGIFIWGEDEHAKSIKADTPIYTYGLNESDYIRATNIQRTVKGSSFDVSIDGENIGNFQVPLFGEHNVLNSLAVIGVGHMEKLDHALINRELQTFSGVKRRFSEKKVADQVIIDDYAHHPQEIKATIDAARQKYPDKKIIAVFQPHTYTRTLALMDDFAKSLDMADEVYLTNIFGSIREAHGDITSKDLGNKIHKGGKVLTLDNMSPLLEYHNTVMIFMGAGDVQKYETAYEQLLSTLNPNQQ